MEAYTSFWTYLIDLHKVDHIYQAGLIATVVIILAIPGRTTEFRLLILPMISYGGELVAAYFGGFLGVENNHWVYNLLEIPILMGMAYAFYYYDATHKRKRLFGWGMLILLLYHLGYLFIWGDLYWIDMVGICYGMILTSIMAYLCLVQLVETVEGRLTNRLLFWFAGATFIFLIGRIPITALIFGAPNMDLELSDRMYVINDVIYIAWFIIITTGVIITTKWTKGYTSR